MADEDRELTPAELRKLMISKEYEDNWESRLSDETADDVDENTLKRFFSQAVQCSRLPEMEYDRTALLERLNVLRSGYLTNAGQVLFSKNRPVTLKLAVFATQHKDTFLDIVTEEGNILSLIDEAVKYVIKNIRWSVELTGDGIHRNEIPEIPVDALREAIVNSFAHARYDLPVQHEVSVFSNRIAITNPGSFANDFTPDDFYTQDIHSYLRNETIAHTLYLSNRFMNTIEQIGRYACIILMWLPLLVWKFGFSSVLEMILYLIGNGCLLAAYWIIFACYLKWKTASRALILAVLPACIFLLSGLLLRHWLLVGSALLFAVGHIFVTQKNAAALD